MKKKILAMVLCLVMIFTTNAFAYRWIQAGTDWYVLNEDTGEFLTGRLLDVGDNVYYLNESGKLVTGWWKNNTTQKFYFFDNRVDKNYGGMVFGLHMIDGYLYYFGDDGSLQTSERKGLFRKVYQDYFADSEGHLYFNDELMRDTSIARSEFYTNLEYYTNPNFNNYYLSQFDRSDSISTSPNNDKSEINASHAKEQTKTSASTTSGGTNYSVDEYGITRTYGDIYETQPAEKYGPMGIR